MKRLIIGAIAAAVATAPSFAETYAIRAGRLITDAAKPARGASTIIVENGRIAHIEDGNAAVPAGAKVVDLSSKTVLPGLIDSHVHLVVTAGQPWQEGLTAKYSEPYITAIGLRNALVTARAGFTTVRDLGGPLLGSLAMRDIINEGSLPGPRILVAGPALSIIGGHGDATVGLAPEIGSAINKATPEANIGVCTGVLACTEAVRKLAAQGVDVIKFHATGGVLDPGAMGLEQHFTDEEMKAIVDTAHSLGRKAAAHAHGARGILAAVRAGVDSIEHGTFADDAGIKLMKERGTYMVPTLMAFRGLEMYLGKGIFAPTTEAKARLTLDSLGKALGRAYRAGGKIAFGTDAGVFPHGQNAQEIALMVTKGGMTPRDALIAATKGSADLLGIANEAGTLDLGKSADLIAVDGDPLTDPAALIKVSYVMTMGRPIPMD